jgi:hypothetical protein
VAIVAYGETKEDLQADSAARLTTIGAAGGAAAGAAWGATLGLACGPWAVACAPTMAVIAAVSGAMGGSFGAHQRRLSEEHLLQVNAVLENLGAELVLNEMLHQSLSEALPDWFEIAQPEADAVAEVRVKSLELRQHTKERLSFRIAAEMSVSWGIENQKPSGQTNKYQYETALEAVEDLLANEGAGFRREITQCMDRVAGYMARDLRYSGALEFE